VSTAPASADLRFMDAALALSRRGLGRTAPNPTVGALVVKDGVILGRGVTAPGGRPHAERVALDQAGEAARGATIYVTLEPCARRSVSGAASCTEAILERGIARVVIAAADPSPFAAGEGAARLRAAGVEVAEGVRAEAARRLNIGHILRVSSHRPAISLKLAQTMDGFAGTAARGPVAITGPVSAAHTHLARAQNDALMVGVGTLIGDNPKLNVRIAGLEDRAPVRVILDTTLRTPADFFVVQGAKIQPTWIFCGWRHDVARAEALRAAGVLVSPVTANAAGILSLEEVLAALAARGITRLMVEGGPTLAEALANADLIDDFTLMTGPIRIGQGAAAILPGLGSWMRRTDVTCVEDTMWGADRAELYERKR
jgi:diaminohydroxyphosphoribosylaminopyrimidine deaminase/5-amino-6-(5-phosphoribosylamino)uracil reductase